MALLGVHHTSFTVVDLERTIAFYRDLLGFRLIGRKRRSSADLGSALLGSTRNARPTAAEILIADMDLGETQVEFIQYVRPASGPFPGDPSLGGSAHIAIRTDDIEQEYLRLRAAGVEFHSPPRTVQDPGKPVWRWCYFRDPDGICVELVESGATWRPGARPLSKY